MWSTTKPGKRRREELEVISLRVGLIFITSYPVYHPSGVLEVVRITCLAHGASGLPTWSTIEHGPHFFVHSMGLK